FGGGVIGNTAGSGPAIGGSSPPPRALFVRVVAGHGLVAWREMHRRAGRDHGLITTPGGGSAMAVIDLDRRRVERLARVLAPRLAEGMVTAAVDEIDSVELWRKAARRAARLFRY